MSDAQCISLETTDQVLPAFLSPPLQPLRAGRGPWSKPAQAWSTHFTLCRTLCKGVGSEWRCRIVQLPIPMCNWAKPHPADGRSPIVVFQEPLFLAAVDQTDWAAVPAKYGFFEPDQNPIQHKQRVIIIGRVVRASDGTRWSCSKPAQ
jgi:hypothetical protein